MLLNDPFPVGSLPWPVKETILTEFQGRHPTVLEVASIPDAHWLKLPAMGPSRVAQLRSLMQEVCNQLQPPALTKITVEDLLAQHHQLATQQDMLNEQQRKLRDKIRATKAELWMRGIVPQVE